MDEKSRYYALCLIRANRSKDVAIADRLSLVSDRLAVVVEDTTVALTDRGKDKLLRKGK